MKYLFLLLALAGCSTVNEALKEPVKNYAPTMKITVDGVPFMGIAVTRIKPGVNPITIESPVKYDALLVESCGRFDQVRRDKPDSLFGLGAGKSKPYTYPYEPKGSEIDRACTVSFEAYDYANALADWGIVVYSTDTDLYGYMICNGRGVQFFEGYSVCASKEGLEQTLSFKVDTEFTADKSCNMVKVDPLTYKLRPTLGICQAVFLDKDGHRHRLLMRAAKRPIIKE